MLGGSCIKKFPMLWMQSVATAVISLCKEKKQQQNNKSYHLKEKGGKQKKCFKIWIVIVVLFSLFFVKVVGSWKDEPVSEFESYCSARRLLSLWLMQCQQHDICECVPATHLDESFTARSVLGYSKTQYCVVKCLSFSWAVWTCLTLMSIILSREEVTWCIEHILFLVPYEADVLLRDDRPSLLCLT